MSEWKPIETAPDDGRVIDLWRCGERLTDMMLVKERGIIPYYTATKSGPTCVRDASHWMPIQEPPKE